MDKLVFRSIPKFFNAEKSGVKNNSVRNTFDWSFERWESFVLSDEVTIISTDSTDSFTRKITHKAIFKGHAIITWKHEN